MSLAKRLWPIVIICSALAVLVAMLVLPGLAIRPLLIMWFLFICPGMALVRFFHLKDHTVKLTLAAALSFSIDGLITGCYLYAGHWSPRAIMLTLAVFSIAAVIIELTNTHGMLYQHVGFIRRLKVLLTHPLIIGTSTATPQLASVAIDIQDIVEMPTAHIDIVKSTTTNTASIDIEESPTVQIASVKDVPARVEIDEQPTVQIDQMPIAPQTQQQATTETKERHPAESLSQEETSDDVDIEQKATAQIASVPVTSQPVRDEDKKPVQVFKPFFKPFLPQRKLTTEKSVPDNDDTEDHDIENRLMRYIPSVKESEQTEVEQPETQMVSRDNGYGNVQR